MCAMQEARGSSVEPAAGSGLAEVSERAREYARSSLAASTRVAYGRDWGEFEAWAAAEGYRALPASQETVCAYVSQCADLYADGQPVFAPATLERRVAAIGSVHQWAGFASPTSGPMVATVLAGVRRELSGKRPVRRMTPLLVKDVRHMVQALPTTWPGCVCAARDEALLLLGWFGGFRRSELAALTWADVAPGEAGLAVTVRGGKTDQTHRGQTKAIPRASAGVVPCPVCALARWARVQLAGGDRVEVMRAVLGKRSGGHCCSGDTFSRARTELAGLPVLPRVNKHGGVTRAPISGHAVALVVADRAAKAGLEGRYGGHSLRAGFVTEALRRGATYAEVMAQTGHTDPATVEIYNRRTNPFGGNAVTRLGL